MLPPFDPDYEFGHVIPQLSWEWVEKEIRFPAVLKPVNGYAWRNVYFVNNIEELKEIYKQTGSETMLLQEKVNYEEYVRAFVVGKKAVLPVKYLPSERKYFSMENFLCEKMKEKIRKICVKLNTILDYDINTVEIGIESGIPYLIDFSNYVPEIKRYNLPIECYHWVVDRITELIVNYARNPKRNRNMFPI